MTKLTDQSSWTNWYQELRTEANLQGNWHLIDPEAEDATSPMVEARPLMTLDEYTASLNISTLERYSTELAEWARSTASQEERGFEPTKPATITNEQTKDDYNIYLKIYTTGEAKRSDERERYQAVHNWIRKTVAAELYSLTSMKLSIQGTEPTLQAIIRDLKQRLAPSHSSTLTTVRETYNKTLMQAKLKGQSPERWLQDWEQAYLIGEAHQIPEVQGAIAVRAFLEAISLRIHPEWAKAKLDDFIIDEAMGQPTRSLQWHSRALRAVLNARTSSPGVGNYLVAQENASEETSKQAPKRSSNEEAYDCPCFSEKGKTHRWKPSRCAVLRWAITGTPPPKRIRTESKSKDELAAIRTRLQYSRFKDVLNSLKGQEWYKKAQTNKGDEQGFPAWPGPVVAAIIDPLLLERIGSSLGVYSVLPSRRHPLADSTLLDNCGAVHVVNAKDLLLPDSITPTDPVPLDVGTGQCAITAYGTRVITKVFNGARGERTEDLTLKEVALVEGFHTNIVSEARLLEKGVWIAGIDSSLRIGTLENSRKIAQLERHFNLTFLEYKPISLYSEARSIPVSFAGLFLTAKIRLKEKAQRPLLAYLQPRSDSELTWHLRAGHLGREALRALVMNARNVRIHGNAPLRCESCALARATQVISRTPSENRAPRPFYRVSFDLFDFPKGQFGDRWLLVIKEEYSGKLEATPLPDKSLASTLPIIQEYESRVTRQYRLAIVAIRQDQDTGTIAINGESAFQRWCKELGIQNELTPTSTHEPNGGSERAGKEIVVKAIAMLQGAGLPDSLWAEACQAAAWLYNRSPCHRNALHSPNEVLDLWFRQHFRWYAPEITKALTVDLRPDWNGIYAYGCRAYALNKKREQGIGRREFKTKPRAHIGYLVGYIASNIYRIWVPELDKVIITRNVRFDERLFYSDHMNEEEKLTKAEAMSQVAEIEEDEHTPEQVRLDGIIDKLDLWDGGTQEAPLDDRNPSITLEEREEAPSEESLPEEGQPDGQDSGVGASVLETSSRGTSGTLESKDASTGRDERRVLTPLPTPEPEREEIGDTIVVAQDESAGSPPRSSRAASPVGDTIIVAPESSDDEIVSIQGEENAPEEAQDERDGAPDDRLGTRLDAPTDDPRMLEGTLEAVGAYDGASTEHQSTLTVPEGRPRGRARGRGNGAQPQPLRQSRRIRAMPPDDPTEGGEKSGIYATIAYRADEIVTPSGQNWDAFVNTFLPDQREALHEGDRAHRTLHAMIAAAIHGTRERVETLPPLLGTSGVYSNTTIHRDSLQKAPRNWRELQNHPYKSQFTEAAHKEVQNMIKMKVFRKIERSRATTRLLPLKWVFGYKFDKNGHLLKCKARLVVRGDLQERNTLTSTYAATLAARTFRLAMALGAEYDLEIRQFDITGAFLQAFRNDGNQIHCELPEGMEESGICLEVTKALYGLRDSPLLWYKEFCNTLLLLGLTPSTEEPCLFVNGDRTVMIVFYVDDILVLYHKKHSTKAEALIEEIKVAYELEDHGAAEWFLGIRIIRDRAAKTITLAHDAYIEKIATRFELANNAHIPSTPLPFVKLEKNPGTASKAEIKAYQERIGSILYTAIMLRPDVAFAASTLSHFLTNPSKTHFAAAAQVIRYLFTTRLLGIRYGGWNREAQALLIASDASFADDPETRRSSDGYILTLFGGPIMWRAARQNTVTTSTTEAELLSLSHTAKETMALKRLFRDIGLDLGELWNIYCDNQQTIRLVIEESTRLATKLRHIDIHNMWLKQEHLAGSFRVTYIPTDQMPADGLTKNLTRQQFEHFRALLNLQRAPEPKESR